MEKELKDYTLVLSGGGAYIFNMLGALQKTNQDGLWSIDKVKKIRGSSAGGVLAVILSLKFEWPIVVDYFVDRPWEKVFNVNLNNLIASYELLGMYGKDIIYEILSPLMLAKGLDLHTITIKQFVEWSGIDIHLYAVEIIDFKLVSFCVESTPDVLLIQAIQATMAIPLIFQPIKIDNKLYADGALICNFPNENEDEFTIGFIIKYNKINCIPNNIQEYMSMIIDKLVNSNELQKLPISNIMYHIPVEKQMTEMNASTFYNLLCSKEERHLLYMNGMEFLKPPI